MGVMKDTGDSRRDLTSVKGLVGMWESRLYGARASGRAKNGYDNSYTERVVMIQIVAGDVPKYAGAIVLANQHHHKQGRPWCMRVRGGRRETSKQV